MPNDSGGGEATAPVDAPVMADVVSAPEAGDDAGADVSGPADTGAVDVVEVVEAGPPPVTVHCGQQNTCTAPEFCCLTNSGQMQACSTSLNDCSNLGGTTLRCTTSAQCASGEVCCGQRPNSNVYQDVSCQRSCGGNNDRQFCDPSTPSDCPQGRQCQLSQVLANYYVCL
jgi:hypothetical protein